MSEDRSGKATSQRSWIERLSHALLREPQDRDQLVELLRDARRRDLLDADALAMIEGVLQVSELRVRDIMIPRAQMAVVQKDHMLKEFLPAVIESAHSRLPVIGEDRGEVVGILLAKDLLPYAFNPDQAFNLRDVMRPAVVVPESKRLDMMLREFRASRNHMAIVVDEYGVVAGLVTIEDVLEQIVGEIEDEHDVEEDTYIRKRSEYDYAVKALTPIENFNEYFSTDFGDDEFDTLGGLVLSGFGHVPKRGEVLNLGRFRFQVLRADDRRVHLLNVQVLAEESANRWS